MGSSVLRKLNKQYSKPQGTLFVVSGPSGSGKTTLCARLLKSRLGLVRSVSATTRARRGREKNNIDYIYLTVPEFKRRLKNHEFVEYANVFGCYYGTPRKFIRESMRMRRDVLLNIDVQGAEQVKKRFKQAVLIFILPPTMKSLKQRLMKRSSDTAAQIRKRLMIARKELGAIGSYDYVVINNDIDEAVRALSSVIKAARLRRR